MKETRLRMRRGKREVEKKVEEKSRKMKRRKIENGGR